MLCPRDDALLSAFHDGELEQTERREVEAHARGCAACAELLASFRSWSFDAATPDPGFVVRFRQTRDAESRGWAWRQLALRLLPVAAAVVVAAVISVLLSSAPTDPLRQVELEALGDPIALEAGDEFVLSIAFEPFPGELP